VRVMTQPHGETHLQEEGCETRGVHRSGEEGDGLSFPFPSYPGDSFRSKTGKILVSTQNRQRAIQNEKRAMRPSLKVYQSGGSGQMIMHVSGKGEGKGLPADDHIPPHHETPKMTRTRATTTRRMVSPGLRGG